jgi:hypothetical protein
VFIKPSVESQGPEYAIEVSGAYNWFKNARFEGNYTVLMTGHSVSLKTFENQFLGGYGVSNVVVTEVGVVAYNAIWNSRSSTIDGSGSVMNMRNAGSGSNPILQFFDTGYTPFGKSNTATDWSGRITSQGYLIKKSTDAHERLFIKGTGTYGAQILFGDGTATASVAWFTGAGSPQGVYAAPVGSLYTRTDGGANTTLYIKESGTGNTGWVAK